MNDLSLTTLDGGMTMIGAPVLEAFAASLRGDVLNAGDPGYDEARTVWNAMIDRRPGLIVRCAGAADVVAAVNFARDNQLLVAVRGGGHNIAGSAVCDGGLMIDLSQMKSVRVDTAGAAGLGRAGRDAGRPRQGNPGLRAGGADRHQLDHRRCRADAGRRLRLDDAQARPDHRQSAFGRRGDRQTANCCGRARANMPTCSGRCAAAAAISAWSPPSSSSSPSSARR